MEVSPGRSSGTWRQYLPMRVRRRSASVCLVLLLCLIPLRPLSAAPVKARHVTFEAAEGTWFLKRKGDVYIYYVIAYRIERLGKPARRGLFVDSSKCRLRGTKKRKLASCTLGGRDQKLEARHLRFDPLLGGARLKFGDHRIVWENPQGFEPDVAPFVDPEVATADAYFERLSNARGRLEGTRMPRKALDYAVLSYGADAAVRVSQDEVPPFRSFEITAWVRTR